MNLHDDWDEDGWTHALEQDVGEGLKDGVGDEEDRQSGIVGSTAETEILSKSIDLGIADIGTVQEGEQIQQTEL